MNTPRLSYPRAPQIAANPKESEHYIKSQSEEIELLRAALGTIRGLAYSEEPAEDLEDAQSDLRAIYYMTVATLGVQQKRDEL